MNDGCMTKIRTDNGRILREIHILRLKYVQTLFYRVRIPQKKMPRTQTLCKAIQKMLPENQTVVRRNKRFNLAA